MQFPLFFIASLLSLLSSCFSFLLPCSSSSRRRCLRSLLNAQRLSSDALPSTDVESVDRRSLLLRPLGALLAAGIALPLPAAAGVKRCKNCAAVELDNGVRYQDVLLGDGNQLEVGDTVAIHYSLFCNGIEVESTRDSSGLAARPFGFTYGGDFNRKIPKALEDALEGMKVGGRRKVVLPSAEAYGEKGRGMVPPNTPVEFDVTVWSVKKAGTNPNLTLPGSQNFF